MYDISNATCNEIGGTPQYNLEFNIQVEPGENVVFYERQPSFIAFNVVQDPNQQNPEIHIHHIVDRLPEEESLLVKIDKDGEEVSNTTVQYE